MEKKYFYDWLNLPSSQTSHFYNEVLKPRQQARDNFAKGVFGYIAVALGSLGGFGFLSALVGALRDMDSSYIPLIVSSAAMFLAICAALSFNFIDNFKPLLPLKIFSSEPNDDIYFFNELVRYHEGLQETISDSIRILKIVVIFVFSICLAATAASLVYVIFGVFVADGANDACKNFVTLLTFLLATPVLVGVLFKKVL